ncbi:hypothetical protein QYF36_026085 [Acer negundo]|nr:hypothetical protein QYF36_026085 [Acer negundo]
MYSWLGRHFRFSSPRNFIYMADFCWQVCSTSLEICFCTVLNKARRTSAALMFPSKSIEPSACIVPSKVNVHWCNACGAVASYV